MAYRSVAGVNWQKLMWPLWVTQGRQDESLVSNARSGPQAALSGQPEHHEKLDDAHPELGQHFEPVSHPFCRTLSTVRQALFAGRSS